MQQNSQQVCFKMGHYDMYKEQINAIIQIPVMEE